MPAAETRFGQHQEVPPTPPPRGNLEGSYVVPNDMRTNGVLTMFDNEQYASVQD